MKILKILRDFLKKIDQNIPKIFQNKHLISNHPKGWVWPTRLDHFQKDDFFLTKHVLKVNNRKITFKIKKHQNNRITRISSFSHMWSYSNSHLFWL
jgi:hypothetical protein